MLVPSLREPRWLLHIHLRGSATEFQQLELHVKSKEIIYNSKQTWPFFFLISLHFDLFFPHPGFMPAPFYAPPPGQNSSQSKQWMAAAHQLLSPARGVKRKASWREICFNAVIRLSLKYMPLLSHFQKVLFKIYLKSSQWASVGSWGWEAILGNTKLPFFSSPQPVIWVGQGVAEVQCTSDQFCHL